jgi:hypothetical protein
MLETVHRSLGCAAAPKDNITSKAKAATAFIAISRNIMTCSIYGRSCRARTYTIRFPPRKGLKSKAAIRITAV